MTTKSISIAVHAVFWATTSALATSAITGHNFAHPYLWGAGAVIALWSGLSIAIANRFQEAAEEDWGIRLSGDQCQPTVDVWGMQRELMGISDQQLPDGPVITKGTLLYFALIMEELGETASGLAYALADLPQPDLGSTIAPDPHCSALLRIRRMVTDSGFDMRERAGSIRMQLGLVPDDFTMPLTMPAAVELLDGMTDVHVTTAGMSLSTGLPGAMAYAEVVGSNLSKANPYTGKIDKDPSGKWIKGSSYMAPSLASVIRRSI